MVTSMDSEVIDHHSAPDKQNYVGHNDVDLPITPIPVVASTKAKVQYDREGSSEYGQPSSDQGVSGENRPSLHQPVGGVNNAEWVESTSSGLNVQLRMQPQNTSLRPMLQRSHDSLPNLALPNNPQESQSNLSTAMRSLSLTDQTTSLASFKDDDRERISVEGYYIGQQHPTNLSASMPTLPSSNINHNQHGHALGEEFQANQSQHALSNQEGSWNQPSNHYGPYSQDYVSIQYQLPPDLTCPHCGNRVFKKKVFILHFHNDCIEDNPVLKLGVALHRMAVDVTLDLFEYDYPPSSWPLWYEQKMKESDVVLCVITEDFYHKLISSNNLMNSTYQLSTGLKPTFRAVFINAKEKKMEYIPPFMRSTTYYSVFSDKLTPNDEGFANLYAFLTGQNRLRKPKLGKIIRLWPEQSSIYRSYGGSHSADNRDIQQQNQAEFILRNDATPVKSMNGHSRMLMQLASNMITDWEPLGRMLGVSEANMCAIKADYPSSVTERAMQMFNHWLMNYLSEATLGALATAVFECGPQYWNLLDIINKYAPYTQPDLPHK